MLGISLIIAAAILALPLFQLARIGAKALATIDDLTAALDREAASIDALAAAIASLPPPIDLQASVDRVNAFTAQVDSLTTALGGTPPPGP